MPHQPMTDAAMRRWQPHAKAMLAAMAALIMLTSDMAARELRHTQSPEETVAEILRRADEAAVRKP